MVRNFAFSNYVPSSSCLDVHVQGVLHSVQLCSTFHWQSAMQCCLVYMVKLSRESACHSLLGCSSVWKHLGTPSQICQHPK